MPEIDDEYVERMEDVLDLYERPYDEREPVVCLDEKPVQLLSETREPIPARPGSPQKRDYEYKREGTANVFMAVEPKAGKFMPRATRRRTAKDFAAELKEIASIYAGAKTIHLVMDNLNTHSEKSLIEAFGPEAGARLWSRFTVHYTPKHASWLNQAEIAISMFGRSGLGKTRVASHADLIKRTKAWKKSINRQSRPFQWRFTKTRARRKFGYSVHRGRIKRSEH